MPENKREYRSSITVPIMGEIPLNLSEILEDLKVRENPPLWAQFFKYIAFGCIAAGVVFAVYFVARTFYGDYISDDLPKEVLKSHLAWVMFIAFIISNIISYTTNRMFVFTPSHRHWVVEFVIFLSISGVSFFAGNVVKDWFIDRGLNKDIAVLSFVISSAVVNFIARKYLVFSKNTDSVESEEAI